MKNLKRILLILVSMGLMHCSGSSGTRISVPIEILFSMNEPEVAFSLSADDYEYQFLAYTSQDLMDQPVFGPATMASYNSDEGVYSVRADDLLPGQYWGEIQLVKKLEDDSVLELLSASFEISIEEGVQNLTMSDLTWSDAGLDADLDGLPNLNEILNESDAFNPDSDGDGIEDGVDAFPLNSSESFDFDGDGLGDNKDSDIDNDGLSNSEEAELGTDPVIADTDGDSLLDGADNCPIVENLDQSDTDSDGNGDECDDDLDGDGLSSTDELSLGTNPILFDTDSDGVSDSQDDFPLNSAESLDSDQDGIGNVADTDDDNDGVLDTDELIRGSSPLDSDTDDDLVPDNLDNCVVVQNFNQLDSDSDEEGDECDLDDDNDGVSDAEESVIGDDGFITNVYLADSDGDGFNDSTDNCPNTANINQSDADLDGFGSNCDCNDTDSEINQLALDRPDGQIIDSNCDGIDGNKYESVFVSSDGVAVVSSTSLASPTSDLSGALEFATENDLDVLISEGSYNVDGLSIPSGSRVFGGFDASFLQRNIDGTSQTTELISSITNSDGAVITISNDNAGTILGGLSFKNLSEDDYQQILYIEDSNLIIENCQFIGNESAYSEELILAIDSTILISGSQFYGHSSYDSTGISTIDSELTVSNSIFSITTSEHVKSLDLNGGSLVLSNNTLDNSGSNHGTSYGVRFYGTEVSFKNNLFLTQSNRNQASLKCTGIDLDSPFTVSNNAFVRMSTNGKSYPVYLACNGDSLFTNSDLSSSTELDAEDNLVESSTSTSVISNYVTVSNLYQPTIGSSLIDAGTDTDSESDGAVKYDLLGQSRTLGQYDIGAIEY